MPDGDRSDSQTIRWLRWLARGWGLLVAAFWLFVGVVTGLVGSEPWTSESTILAGLIVASALGVVAAWWRAGVRA